MEENIKKEKGFTQVCVWSGTVVGVDKVDEFILFMKDEFDVRIQYLEEIKTLPDTNDIGDVIPETGNRNDLFFVIHDEDAQKFAIHRLKAGIRWIEDVLSSTNYHCQIYPKRVFEYKCWQ